MFEGTLPGAPDLVDITWYYDGDAREGGYGDGYERMDGVGIDARAEVAIAARASRIYCLYKPISIIFIESLVS